MALAEHIVFITPARWLTGETRMLSHTATGASTVSTESPAVQEHLQMEKTGNFKSHEPACFGL